MRCATHLQRQLVIGIVRRSAAPASRTPELARDRVAADAEQARGFDAVAAGDFECRFEQGAVEQFACFVEHTDAAFALAAIAQRALDGVAQ